MPEVVNRRYRSALAGLVAVAVLAACTTVETQSFRRAGSGNVDAAYIATDADFSQYDRLLVDDMGIFFPQSVTLPDDELRRIRRIFRDVFTEQLEGYDITQQPGPGMLRVSASLIDLREASIAEIPNLRPQMRDAARPGGLVFMMELKDSTTDRVLARAGDSQAAPRFASPGGAETDWASVEAAARHWAALFRDFLDQNLGR